MSQQVAEAAAEGMYSLSLGHLFKLLHTEKVSWLYYFFTVAEAAEVAEVADVAEADVVVDIVIG